MMPMCPLKGVRRKKGMRRHFSFLRHSLQDAEAEVPPSQPPVVLVSVMWKWEPRHLLLPLEHRPPPHDVQESSLLLSQDSIHAKKKM